MRVEATPTLVGGTQLTRAALQRDRARIITWVLAIIALVVATVGSIEGLYPTAAKLEQAARAARDNAAAIVFNGPPQGLDTAGGQVAFQVGAFGLVVVGLMSMFTLGRLTRGEEEVGRLELVRALPIGIHAPTVAAFTIVVAMNVVVGAAVGATGVAFGLPATGSAVFGTSFALFGMFVAGVTLVAAQLSAFTRVAYGITGAVLGVSYALRAVGDVGDGSVAWLSPIGWAQKARPYAGDRWWPLLVLVVATLALVVLAEHLAARRDLGAGLFPARAGPSCAAARLGTPIGLATRLLRASALGWLFGIVVTAVAYGSLADSINDFVADNEAVADLVAAQGGGDILDSYLAMSSRILALLAAAFGVQAMLRLRSEELAHHGEAVLSTPVSRVRWGASHLVAATAGSALLLVAAGAAVGIAAALVTGDGGLVASSLGAAIAYAPACWVMVGVATAAVGRWPGSVVAVWSYLGACVVVALLGQLLALPSWVLDLSPFEHVPLLPAHDLRIRPLGALVLVAACLAAIGLTGLRRRDIE